MKLLKYTKGREKRFSSEYTEENEARARTIVAKASELLSAFGEDRDCTLGWTPIQLAKNQGWEIDNKLAHAQAIGIEDHDKKFGHWCCINVERLIELGLYMKSLVITHLAEEPHVYLTVIEPDCGSRIYS